jgi:hypothetical protein
MATGASLRLLMAGKLDAVLPLDNAALRHAVGAAC